LPHFLKANKLHLQPFVLGIQKISNEMDLDVIELGCEFARRDKLDPQLLTCCSQPRTALHRVMVRQRDRFQRIAVRLSRQLFRRVGAVRKAGVQMKVSQHGTPLLRESIYQ
jgi:hypothetical protein